MRPAANTKKRSGYRLVPPWFPPVPRDSVDFRCSDNKHGKQRINIDSFVIASTVLRHFSHEFPLKPLLQLQHHRASLVLLRTYFAVVTLRTAFRSCRAASKASRKWSRPAAYVLSLPTGCCLWKIVVPALLLMGLLSRRPRWTLPLISLRQNRFSNFRAVEQPGSSLGS